jgi:ubiquinone/menaquinone biosynthesis C-methylase UbiE
MTQRKEGYMNTIWSENIQGIKTLYLSRKLRFDDFFFEQYEKLFSLDKSRKLRILEIGCGPGALAGALHRWYPNAEVVAIDRDSNFIAYAKEHEAGVEFLEGDAMALPFEDNSFDVTISNTVCEHIQPTAFYAEQKRVLKENGICLVLSARKGVNQRAKCIEMTEEEKQFWNREQGREAVIEPYAVAKYSMTEQELPVVMERNGFKDVSTGYAVVDLTPDNPKYPDQMAEDMINAERYCEIEAVQSSNLDGMDRMIEIINDKYDTRIELYRNGKRQWDTNTSITMIIRGINDK